MSGVAKKANSYPLPFDGLATQLTIGAIPEAAQDACTNIKLVLRYFCLWGETNDRWVEKKCHHFILIVLLSWQQWGGQGALQRLSRFCPAMHCNCTSSYSTYCVLCFTMLQSTKVYCASLKCIARSVSVQHCAALRCRFYCKPSLFSTSLCSNLCLSRGCTVQLIAIMVIVTIIITLSSSLS